MNTEQIQEAVKKAAGTAKTNNDFFETNGYLVVKNLYDAKELICDVPDKKGRYTYYKSNKDKVDFQEVEEQVNGSTSRYFYPQYESAHSQIRLKLEKILGNKLYNTYFYDRFYFPGQELKPHVDRPACEISVTVHVSTNLKGTKADWPIWITTPKAKDCSVILKPGDGMIYKGCECPHWRKKMPGNLLGIGNNKLYYHQIFFHYVLSNGSRSHFANEGNRR